MKNLLQFKLASYIVLLVLFLNLFVKTVFVDQIILGNNDDIPSFFSINNHTTSNFSSYTLLEESPLVLDEDIEKIIVHYTSGKITTLHHENDSIVVERTGHSQSEIGYKITRNTLEIATNVHNLKELGMDKKENDLTIYIPKDRILDYEINTVSSEIDLHALSDRLSIHTISGEIGVHNQVRNIALDFISSKVEFLCTDALETIKINTISGDVLMIDESTRPLNVDISSLGGRFQNHSSIEKVGDLEVLIEISSISGDFIVK